MYLLFLHFRHTNPLYVIMWSTKLLLFIIVCVFRPEVYAQRNYHCRSPILSASGVEGNGLLPTRESCGFQEADRIYHGNITALDEFPWTALLIYRNASGFRQFACGGTLISHKYVLTAAHCLSGPTRDYYGPLVAVRLGEWDTRTKRDCITLPSTSINACNDPPVDVEVESYIDYTSYIYENVNRCDDIALIKLKTSVQFTNFIRPICLPLDDETSRPGEKLIVAGWGKTEKSDNSTVKLKLEVPYVEDEVCSKKYNGVGIRIGVTQFCAGGEAGKDACVGDSGGPLMATAANDSSQWYLEGIVSFGTCTSMRWPAVYTRVSQYLDWIKDNVEP